jgi:hypothetical protein
MSVHSQPVVVALALLALAACSAQAPAPEDELEREESARLADKEGIPADEAAPAARCSGVWDCTKTVFTDFVYLPVNVVRSMSGDVQTTYQQQRSAPADSGTTAESKESE